MNKRVKNYINNADFLAALLDYKEKKKVNSDTPIPNYIGECFMKIADGLSHKPNFINYPCKEDMIGDGIENCLMYFHNFNPDKSNNPFAYFTQIVYYAFLRRIQKEKKQLFAKYKATEQMGILDESEFLDLEGGGSRQFEMYDNIAEFIETYEIAQQKRKDEKKSKVKLKGIENFFEE
jgi:hypothetical protein